jgi:hypothetical protein
LLELERCIENKERIAEIEAAERLYS